MIEVLDTTLRDGEQAVGIEFSQHDKLKAITALSDLGITYIEAGNPYASEKDAEVIAKSGDNRAVAAFGSTRRKCISAESDANLLALAACKAQTVVLFGKAWDLHVDKVLATTKQENLSMIFDSIQFLKNAGKQVIFDAEHFFDGYKSDSEYAIAALKSAFSAGAKRLVLCDTNGGTLPDEIYDITKNVCGIFKDAVIGIHTHDDCDLANACSIAAVKAGATHIQGTFLGFGERCGNANLSSLIAVLQLKMGYEVLSSNNIKKLTKTAELIAECANTTVSMRAPFVGANAFSHKAGMHADGVIKCAKSFEHILPESVGNGGKLILSGLAGRNMIFEKLKALFPYLNCNDERIDNILQTIKDKFSVGYNYEGADGSFFIIAKRALEGYKPFFDLVDYKVATNKPQHLDSIASAEIEVKVGQKTKKTYAEGNGPVHALDVALRAALSEFYPIIGDISLTDYKVRVINSDGATAAKVRVAITTSDSQGSWTTVGVSSDIIQASFLALCDAIDYKLLKQEAAL